MALFHSMFARLRSAHAVMVLSRDQGEETGVFERRNYDERLDSVSFDRISTSSSELRYGDFSGEGSPAQNWYVCAIFARVVTGTGTVGPSREARQMGRKTLAAQETSGNHCLGHALCHPGFSGDANLPRALSATPTSLRQLR